MTEKLYSLDEIEDAIICPENWDCVSTHIRQADLDKILMHVKNRLTRPQPEFREGQVLCSGGDGNWSYVRYEQRKMDLNGRERPLTPEEVGPGYVPVEDVRPLVEYVRNYAPDINLPDNLKELIDE